MSNFRWDMGSAVRKATSGVTVNVCTPTPVVSVCKSGQLTQDHNPNKDAYRNCSACGKHWNYHSNGKCP